MDNGLKPEITQEDRMQIIKEFKEMWDRLNTIRTSEISLENNYQPKKTYNIPSNVLRSIY